MKFMSQRTKNVITEVITGLGLAQTMLHIVPGIPSWVGVTAAALVNVLNEVLKDYPASPSS